MNPHTLERTHWRRQLSRMRCHRNFQIFHNGGLCLYFIYSSFEMHTAFETLRLSWSEKLDEPYCGASGTAARALVHTRGPETERSCQEGYRESPFLLLRTWLKDAASHHHLRPATDAVIPGSTTSLPLSGSVWLHFLNCFLVLQFWAKKQQWSRDAKSRRWRGRMRRRRISNRAAIKASHHLTHQCAGVSATATL